MDESSFSDLREAVEKFGSVRNAAKELNIPRSTLRNRLMRLAGEVPTYDGFRARAVSTMVPNGFGKPEWVKMERRPIVDPAAIAEAFGELEILKMNPMPRCADGEVEGLSIYGIGDQHIGMLSWHRETGHNWTTEIGVQRHREAFDYLLSKGDKTSNALVALMGDNLHANDMTAQTPRSKHSLDVDSRVGKTGWEFIKMADYMVQRALQVHGHVTLVMLAGNHDPDAAQYLNMAFRLRYENEPRVDVKHNAPAMIKHVYGSNLFAFIHGHTMKPTDAPTVMAYDYYEDWGRCRWKYVFSGHFHHSKRSKVRVLRDDLEAVDEGCSIEIFPTIAAPDAYAAGSRHRSTRAMTKIQIHPEQGEIARFLWKAS